MRYYKHVKYDMVVLGKEGINQITKEITIIGKVVHTHDAAHFPVGYTSSIFTYPKFQPITEEEFERLAINREEVTVDLTDI